MPKIMLDAGHFGKRNQSPVVAQYYESVQMWILCLYLKEELEKYGFEVSLTRSDPNKDLDVFKRGQKAKGCDLFLSLHSNAVGGSGNENVDRVDVFYAYDNLNNAILFAKSLSEAIAQCMGIQTANAKNRKSQKGNWDYYGVMRGARMAGCPLYYLLEHSFHTNKKSAEWLLKDENLKALAKAEAMVIAEYFGLLAVGDINGDGILDKKDYALLKRAALGTEKLTQNQIPRADMNGDGFIDKKDYALLKRDVLKE